MLTQRDKETASNILNKRERNVVPTDIQAVKNDDNSNMSMHKEDVNAFESTLKSSSVMTHKIQRQKRFNEPTDDKVLTKRYSSLSQHELYFGGQVQSSSMCDKSNQEIDQVKNVVIEKISCHVLPKIIMINAPC